MWSDAAREAAAATRKANGHNAGGGNRQVAGHVASQHRSEATSQGHGAVKAAIAIAHPTLAAANTPGKGGVIKTAVRAYHNVVHPISSAVYRSTNK